jgi:hypothetical protein
VADERLTRFLTHIYNTNGAEIDCKRLQALLPAYVDYELSAENGTPGSSISADQLAAAQTHLDQCPDCKEIYQGLCQVVSLAASDNLPEVEDLLADFEERTEHEHSQRRAEPVRCSS